MRTQRIVCCILTIALIFCYTSVLAVDSANIQDDEFEIRQILSHDALNQISLTGKKCLGTVPPIIPVVNQDFTKAVATAAVEATDMKVSDVIFRLAPNYVPGSFKAGEVVVMSAWMRVEGESGKASASVETKNNEVKVSTNTVNLTNEWKKYYFIGEVKTDMDSIKASIFVGHSGQITYLSEWKIDAYLNTDAETVKNKLLGDELGNNNQISDEEQERLNQIRASVLLDTSVYICDVPKAYINDLPEFLDEKSSEIVPYIKADTIFVPLRFAAERYGATVEYNGDEPTVCIKFEGREYIMCFNDDLWKFDGRWWKPECSLEFFCGRSYVSAKDFADMLGLEVDVDTNKKLCIFTRDESEMKILSDLGYKEEIYEKVSLIPEEAYTISWEHDSMESRIGIPALIKPTDSIPVLKFSSEYDTTLEYDISYENQLISGNNKVDTKANQEFELNISDKISESKIGEYRVDLRVHIGDSVYYDALYFYVDSDENKKADDSKVVYKNSDGKLVYIPDYRGNRIPDYSSVGYKEGKEKIPDAPTVIELTPSGGDDTDALEQAIKYVSSLPMNEDGIRGAIQFSKGVFQISRALSITASGVVIRGSGNDNPNIADAEPTGSISKYVEAHKDTEGTILLLTSTKINDSFLQIHGNDIRIDYDTGTNLVETYVPTGTNTFLVENAEDYSVGDQIIIKQVGNMAWVHEIGMDKIPARTTADANVTNNEDSSTDQWTGKEWSFERIITAIDGNKITIDVPIVNSIDKKHGGAIMYKFSDEDRLENIGLENMRVVAAWTPNENNADDTLHANILVSMRKAKNLWIRDITAEHFNNSCIAQGEQLKWVTIQDFYNLIAPPSYYMGPDYEETGRTNLHTKVYVGRYGVYLYGQQVLVQRFHGTNNRHLVEYGGEVAGPNVAYDCKSVREFNIMGPHYSWSTGGLYDNVYGGLAVQNRLNMGSGHGWAGAWFTTWNCDSGDSAIAVQKPPTAQNWAIGNVGTRSLGDFEQFEQGYWDLEGTHSNIKSLFLAQKEEKSGKEGLDIIQAKPEYDYSKKDVPSDIFATGIEIGGKQLKYFDKNVYAYDYVISNSVASQGMPIVTATSEYDVEVKQAENIKDYAKITVTDGEYSQVYLLHFKVSPYNNFIITASGDDGNVAENIADGDLTTRWSASGDGQWLSFEFDNPSEVSGIGISFYNGAARSTKFDIEISNDGVNWEKILSESSSGFTDAIEKYSVKPFVAKYLRFVGHGNSTNLWNSVQEIEFYAKDGEKLYND